MMNGILLAVKEQGDFGFEWINTILIWGVTIIYPIWLLKGAVKWAVRKLKWGE